MKKINKKSIEFCFLCMKFKNLIEIKVFKRIFKRGKKNLIWNCLLD